MGREATCECRWGRESGECHVLLETRELIVRGEIRRKAAIASLEDVAVSDEALTFRVDGERVSLMLGAEMAEKWRLAIVTPPPTLAKKLGIVPDMQVLVIGEICAEELESALAEADVRTGGKQSPALIVVCADQVADLDRALARATAFAGNPPVWLVYPKGAKSTLPEMVVRNMLRGMGWMDVKVAAVSAKYTALKFMRR